MFGLPAPTQFDLRFPLMGIPVRVNPFFWALAAYLGWQSHARFEIFVWIFCVFLSVLVHEMGHALTARNLMRVRPSVLLYYIGGVCTYDRETRSPGPRIAVLLMGPGAGFLLFGLVFFLTATILGVVRVGPFFGLEYAHEFHRPPKWFYRLPDWFSQTSLQAAEDLMQINLIWGFFNLLPIFPLDGGQITSVLLTMRNKWEGARWAYMVSMITACLIAFVLYSKKQEMTAFMLVALALMNFQLWQAAKYQGPGGGLEFEDDDDWWKR